MKKNHILQTLVMIFFVFTANAQRGINYKAIIKDGAGAAIANTTVTVQFTIFENGTTEVYKETHNPTTDANGIVIVNIGEGTDVNGVFNDIDWGSNPHYLKTEINTGSGLTDMGTTEFKTVPYALHAKTAKDAALKSDINDLKSRIEYLENVIGELLLDNDIDNDGDGFTENEGDCDDTDDEIYPGATEICGDGIDNDCDGYVDCFDNECTSPLSCASVDIMILFDKTGDMSGAIAQVQNNYYTIVASLQESLSDLAIGLATFQDFPISPYGEVTDQPYQLLNTLTNNYSSVFSSLNNITASGGGDFAESGNEALYQIATGAGISNSYISIPPSNSGFREGSRKLVLLITSATFHDNDYPADFNAHSKIQAIDALNLNGISVISMNVGADAAVRDNLVDIAIITNTTIPSENSSCPTGLGGSITTSSDGICPLVYEISSDGSGISSQIVYAVLGFLDQ